MQGTSKSCIFASMKKIEDLLRLINSDASVISDIDWIEESGVFDENRLRDILNGIKEYPVAKGVADFILADYDYLKEIGDERLKEKKSWQNKMVMETDAPDKVVDDIFKHGGSPEDLWENGYEVWQRQINLDEFIRWNILDKREKIYKAQCRREELRRSFQKQKEPTPIGFNVGYNGEESDIPNEIREKISRFEEIDTEDFWTIVRKLLKAGLLTSQLQPDKKNISWTQAAFMAKKIEQKLNIKARWSLWEEIWNRPTIRDDYSKWGRLKDDIRKDEFEKLLNRVLA